MHSGHCQGAGATGSLGIFMHFMSEAVRKRQSLTLVKGGVFGHFRGI